MKTLTLLLFLAVTFSACSSSTYYMTTIASNTDYVEQVANGDFLIENDTLWVAHSFSGRNAAVQVTVFNKSDASIYVDWEKSSFFVDGRKFSYTSIVLDWEGKTAIHPLLFDSKGLPLDPAIASQSLPKQISRIPPNTMISLSAFRLNQIGFQVLPKKGYKRHKVDLKKDKVAKARKIDYTPDNTPMKLASSLYISSADEVSANYSQDFYLQNIVKSKKLKPKAILPELAHRGDILYLEKPASNRFMKSVGKGAAIAGLVFVGIVTDTTISNSIDSDFSVTTGIVESLIEN